MTTPAATTREGRICAPTPLPAAARYEFGTRALADFAGLDRALTWMKGVGWSRVEQRIQDLVGRAVDRATQSEHLDVSSPTDPGGRSGAFVLRLPRGCDSGEVYERLRSDDRILASPVRQERDLRISIHFFNTLDEIDAAFEAITRICAS